jgi:hypothetical protein
MIVRQRPLREAWHGRGTAPLGKPSPHDPGKGCRVQARIGLMEHSRESFEGVRSGRSSPESPVSLPPAKDARTIRMQV